MASSLSWPTVPILFAAIALLLRADCGDAAEPVLSKPIALLDLTGKEHRLEPNRSVTATAFVFISTECPIARGYIPTLNRIAKRLSDRNDAAFFGVISDPTTAEADAKKFAAEFAVEFPVLFDNSGQLAIQLRPSHVPEAFVLDAHYCLAYRGRIDDIHPQIGKRRVEATEHNLRDAIDSVLAGKPVAVPRTKPVGCLFEAWKEQD